jgi:hypothetical protein
MPKNKSDQPEKPEKPGGGRGRPPKMATDVPAKKGSNQAKVNSSHRGKKLNQWPVKNMDWCLAQRAEDVKNLPEAEWKSYDWYKQQTGISKSTLWGRFSGKVKGSGHQSGGKNKGRSLPPAAEKALGERASKYTYNTFCMSAEVV